MAKPIERIAALKIGSVEYVSPAEIRVLLEIDAPQTTALNTGVPNGFPRINSYVLIPNEAGAVVGLVTWLGIEPSNFPKRTGFKDFGLVDLPYPLRKMSVTPLGTLCHQKQKEGVALKYRLVRGVSVFPSVGDSVLLPSEEQLISIVESEGKDRRVLIGVSPLAGNAKVTVDPDKLFGRHLAVLGNTGSGKSCTVAGLIRWSLEAAKKEMIRSKKRDKVNARFIILDPNGEYSQAFSDMRDQVRVFRVPPAAKGIKDLFLPAWMWNSHEWASFAAAAPGAQRPVLLQALRDLRAGAALQEPIEFQINRLFRTYKSRLEQLVAQGASGYSSFPANLNCAELLRNVSQDAQRYEGQASGSNQTNIQALIQEITTRINARRYVSRQGQEGFRDFSETDLVSVIQIIDNLLLALQIPQQVAAPSEDAPIPFDVNQMSSHLEQLAGEQGNGNVAQFVATLSMRIRMMLADRRLGPIVHPSKDISFESWLEDYIGSSSATNGQIAILDLSLVPADVLNVIIAVIARIVFESIQRYRKIYGQELPTVLVLEEAHAFIQRGAGHEEGLITPAQMCRQTFERIAREGRKFGLGLVLSSQRPSELSQTVLAQCNTFILHRIVNDKDQELVEKLVPDNLGGLLKELPSLPARQAILLGWAACVPVLTEILELPDEHKPQSSDPLFWDVWTGVEKRKVDWTKVVKDWIS